MGKFSPALIILSLLFASGSALAVEPTFGRVIEKRYATPILNREFLTAYTNLIDSAKASICMAYLYINEDQTTALIKETLKNAVERGVKVKVLLDDKNSANAKTVMELNGLGIEAKLDSPRDQLHCKLIVVDGAKVLLGSTNLSSRSIDENNETNILLDCLETGKYFGNYFDNLWNNAPKRQKIYFDVGACPGITPVCDSRYFTDVRSIILNSKNRIGIILYNCRYYKDADSNPENDLLNALVAMAGKGRNIRVLLEKSDFDENVNKTNEETAQYLRANGIQVRFDSAETLTHAKLVLADGTAVVGSANWGMAGFSKNRETNIAVKDKKISERYWSYFENIWGEGQVK